MNTLTESQIRTTPESLLEQIRRDEGFLLQLDDGTRVEITVRRDSPKKKHLSEIEPVPGVQMTADEIVEMIHEMHAYEPEWMKKMNDRRPPVDGQ